MATTIWNPSDNSDAILSNNNLTAAFQTTGTTWHSVRSTNSPAKTTGKWHWEVTIDSVDNNNGWGTGIMDGTASVTNYAGSDAHGIMIDPVPTLSRMDVYQNGAALNNYSLVPVAGDIIAIEIDIDNKLIWWQDVTQGSGWTNASNSTLTGNPGAGTGGTTFTLTTTSGVMLAASGAYTNSSAPDRQTLNPGPTFVGTVSTGFSPWDIGASQIVADAAMIFEGLLAALSDPVLADEFLAGGRGDPVVADEFRASGRSDPVLADEFLAGGRSDPGIAGELVARMVVAGVAPDEFLLAARAKGNIVDELLAGARNNPVVDAEFLAGGRSDPGVADELIARMSGDGGVPDEFLLAARADDNVVDELLAGARNDPVVDAEFLAGGRSDPDVADEFLARMSGDGVAPIESLLAARGAHNLADEWLARLLANAGVVVEFAGSAANFFADSLLAIEWLGSSRGAGSPVAEFLAGLRGSGGIPAEFIARMSGDGVAPTELLLAARGAGNLADEWLARLLADAGVPIEFEGSILLISDRSLPIEWSALPAIVRVSLERVLASPSRRRILGTPGRLRLLKRQ